MASANTGIVVIGKNEGERLRACFESLETKTYPVVYVDSGSTDGSISLAESYAVDVLELDMSTPFSAARARNAGYELLFKNRPEIEYVQFIDGDCILDKNWITSALDAFSKDNQIAAVVGHLKEKNPQASVYNRLCDLEWRVPVGDTYNGFFGGIVMLRKKVLLETGGYNPKLLAGEEPELGSRMVAMGYRVVKIDAEMAIHDANMMFFRQWWNRAVRGGRAIGLRFRISELPVTAQDKRARNSTLFWGFFLPLIILLTCIPTKGLSLLLLGGYLLLGYRIYRGRLQSGDNQSESMLYSGFTLLSKFATAKGLINFELSQLTDKVKMTHYEKSD